MELSNFIVENQGIHTYLTYKLAEDDKMDNMVLGMITNNKIDSLLQTIYTQMDEDVFIKYNISSKVSARDYLSGMTTKKRLLSVFSGILSAVIEADEYMIDISSLVIDLNYIFVDVSTGKTELICIPIQGVCEYVDLGNFFKNILFSTQYDPTENSDYIAKTMNYLNGIQKVSPEDFKKVVDDLLNETNTHATNEKNNIQVKKEGTVNQPAKSDVNSAHTSYGVNNDIKYNAAQQKSNSVQGAARQGQVGSVGAQKAIKANTFNQGTSFNNAANNNIPKPQNIQNNNVQKNAQQGDEDKISWLYLMQHYNKENAARYKAQKEAKKNVVSDGNNVNSTAKQGGHNLNAGYAVPGRQYPHQNPLSQGSQKQQSQRLSSGQSFNQAKYQNTESKSIPVANQPVHNSPISSFSPQKYAQASANFGETVVLSADMNMGETTVLSAETKPESSAYLIRANNNERIYINKPVFKIGKERTYVDYFISDNTAISRSHANILKKGENYYIVDSNSTNHTYVNNAIIQGNVEVKLEHGAKVRLANEEFTFYLY